MCKYTSKKQSEQENSVFSVESLFPEKKNRVDFDAQNISSNCGLLLMGQVVRQFHPQACHADSRPAYWKRLDVWLLLNCSQSNFWPKV